jgi:hypothetical protein
MNALSLAELGDVLPALGLADETSPCNFLGSFSDRSDLFLANPLTLYPRTPNHSLFIYPGGLP